MPRSTFLRVLFGDRRIDNFQSVLDEVKWCLDQPFQPSPTLWYVYGLENAKFLRSLGIDPIVMDDEPFCRFGSTRPEQAHHYNTIRWGSACWRMRYPPIRHALETHDEVVSLDLDTILMEPLPDDFWPRMAAGACWQGSLQQNHRARSGHRKTQTWPGKTCTDEDSRKTPAGAFLYWRGFQAIDIALRMYAERPFEYDLHVLARMSDELMGGWKGCQHYKDFGCEPYCFTLGKHEKRQIFTPERRLFFTHWRKPRLRSSGPTETPYMLAGEFPEVKP